MINSGAGEAETGTGRVLCSAGKSGRHHTDRWIESLRGLHKQVGTIYLDHGQDRDSSLGVLIIGPGDIATYRIEQEPSTTESTLCRPEMQAA